MNDNYFDEIKKRLEEMKKDNDNQILINDEKTRMVRNNKFENKFFSTVVFSMFAYLVLFITSFVLTRIFGPGIITNVFPGFTFPLVFIGGSLGIGILSRGILAKKYKTKERFRSFSSSKNEYEKSYEEVLYEIELEKAKNRNKAINEGIKILNSKQMITGATVLNDIGGLSSKEELLENQDKLLMLIKIHLDDLDILSTKKVLHERFWKIRDKFQKVSESMIYPLLSFFITMLFVGFPAMFVQESVTIGTLIIPFLIGIGGSLGYVLKRNNDYKKIFDKFNLEFGEKALINDFSKEINGVYKEESEINAALENQIMNVGVSLVKLEENKISLERYDDNNEEVFVHNDTSEIVRQKENTFVKKRVLKK